MAAATTTAMRRRRAAPPPRGLLPPVLLALLHARAATAAEVQRGRLRALRSSSAAASSSALAEAAHLDADEGARLTPEEQKAVADMNARALVAYEAMDKVRLDCERVEFKIQEELASVRVEVTQLRAALANNVFERSEASAAVRQETQRRREVKENLSDMKRQCDDQIAATRKEREVLEADLAHSRQLQTLVSKCGSSAGASLLQRWQRRSRAGSSASASATAAEVSADQTWALVLLRGATRLQANFSRSAFEEAISRTQAAVDLARRGRCGEAEEEDDGGAGLSLAAVGEARALRADAVWPGKASKRPTQEKHSQQACKQASRFEGLKGAQRCAAFKVELRRMFSGVETQVLKARSTEEAVRGECQSRTAAEQLRAQQSEQRQVAASEDLSRSMAELGILGAGRDAKLQEEDNMLRDLHEEKRTCHAKLSRLAAQYKDVIGMRKTMLPSAQDCSVTGWTWSTCSKKCRNGREQPGVAQGARTVQTVPSSLGMPCPPLQARIACGERPCPRDCRMGVWEEWSACTATCGGGTQTRTRNVVEQDRHGGVVCPPAEDRRVCNIGACSKKCKLGKWSKWGRCSRACRYDDHAPAGRRVKVREVVAPAVGLGSCPDETDPERMKTGRCNKRLCGDHAKCVGEDTVVLVLDGSDSANFTAQVAAATAIVQRASPKMSFGVLAYGSTAAPLAPVTSDRPALLQALQAAAPPGGPPDLGQGEALVKSMFLPTLGTDQRPGTVVLFTDGSPLSFDTAITLSGALRSMGLRLIVGLVDAEGGSKQARENICRMVGRPCTANVEAVKSWDDLARQPWRFLAALCDKLEYPAGEA